jgi:hypothetical protein
VNSTAGSRVRRLAVVVLAATWGSKPPGIVLGLVSAFLAGTVLQPTTTPRWSRTG